MATSSHLGFGLVEASQSQKEVTVNTALTTIDALMNTSVLDKDLATPPGSPSDGDVYIVAASATGDWAGEEGNLAAYNAGWTFITPKEGVMLWVADESIFYFFDGSDWTQIIKQIGRTAVWVPAASFTPNAGSEGAGALTAIEVTGGKPHIKGMEFNNSGVHRAQTALQLPQSWNAGGVEVKVHWLTRVSGTNTVRWLVTGASISDGDDLDADYASDTNIDDDSQGADKKHISAATLVSVGGTLAKGDTIELQVSRNYDGTNDDINGSVYLLGVEVLYFADESVDA